jgi:mycothiol synthase
VPGLSVVDRLTSDDVTAVRDLVERVTEADGVGPMSEHVLLHLPAGGDERVRHVLARADDGKLVGYAHLDVTDPVEGSSAELAVDPDARRAGIGRSLVDALLGEAADGRLRLWAHGSHPAAGALASELGFSRARVLLQMRRALDTPLPSASLPSGVTVRTFEVGHDEEAWLALNARAFAEHPEQGKWGRQELQLRLGEPWFDPSGFFLAFRGSRLVGFHWTKVHGGWVGDEQIEQPGAEHGRYFGGELVDDDPAGHAHEPVGEVYVVGVDPSEQGHGLGPALTLVGLHSLRDRGLTEVILYVDESNVAAVRTYERLGFSTSITDVSYTRG